MKVYYSNINNFNEEIEEFVIAKSKIEKPLIENCVLEKKMSITEFINFINLNNNIYILNDKLNSVIPFDIKKPNDNEIVVFYSSTNDDKINQQFKKDLEKIDFDLSNLEHITQLQLLNGEKNLNSNNYFIINGEFYI